MTAKRYYAHKHLIDEDKVHDKICHRFMNITETVEHMNMYYQKYTALKQENEQLKEKIKREIGHNQRLHQDNCELHKENEQLRKENNKLHQKIFEMRTNVALERTEISRQSYTSKEFLDEIEKW